MTWTHIYNITGGSQTVGDYNHIYIEAPWRDAREVFHGRFGHDPEGVTCEYTDYSIVEWPSLKQVTGRDRNCRKINVPKDNSGRSLRYISVVRENYYLEPDEEPPGGLEVDSEWSPDGDHIPLNEYVKRDDVLLL